MQVLLQAHQALALLLGELGDRDAGAAGDHLGDVLHHDLRDGVGAVPGPLQLRPDLADLRAQLLGAVVVLGGDGLVLVAAQRLKALLQLAHVAAGRA